MRRIMKSICNKSFVVLALTLCIFSMNVVDSRGATGVPCCISGTKSVPDGESPAGFVIQVKNFTTGALVATNTTDSNGAWEICDLAPGAYNVTEQPKSGWSPNSQFYVIDLPGDCEVSTFNFDNELCCISGTKRVPDGESPAGFVIQVKNVTTGVIVDTATTDPNGGWKICGLAPGAYNVTEQPKSGWAANSQFYVINLPGDCGRDDLDFDNELCCISGTKSVPDGESPAGFVIQVKNVTTGVIVDTATTDPNGGWKICGLAPGAYNVTEQPKSGWAANSQFYVINLPGDCGRDDLDFDNVRLVCISGFKNHTNGNLLNGWTVYVDLDENGDRDANEPFNVTHTDPVYGDGYWKICGLTPGESYIVREVPQPETGLRQFYPPGLAPHVVYLGEVDENHLNFTNGPDFQIPICISGHKFNSIDGKLLDGWTIYVDLNGSGTFDVGEPFNITYTDPVYGSGYWRICGLQPGEYGVCELSQDGWTPVDPEIGCQIVKLADESIEVEDIDFHNCPCNFTIEKKADNYDVKRGGEVTYTITVCNHGLEPERNVTVWDVFNRNDVVILSMMPAPDPDGKWRFDVIPAGKCEPIIIKIRVPERQDFEFGMEQGVRGEGFVKVANDFSTTFHEYLLKNCAYATSDNYRTPISDCVTVTVGRELGTELSTREYGSGLFDVEERVSIFTENKSIEWEEDLSAAYKPTSIVLYHNRIVDYDAAWVKKSRAKNYVTGTTMTETYHDAVRLDRNSRMFLDENESVMEVDSDFDGRGHIGFLKMPTNTSPRQATPIFEMREDYVGSFRVLERIDEYGSSVSSEKAASGRGLVVVDKRVGSAQRTYESGTGAYDSEEIIETSTNYIAKDISLVHAPISQRLTESTSIDASMKWKEGMYSRNPQTSFIGEEYTSITELDKETVARGLNEMETDAEFSGQARFRAILDRSQGGRDPEVDFDEQYSGDYSIQRRVHFSGVAKYDRPHLNVTKTLNRVYVETLPWDYGEPHLEGAIKTRRVADYTIRIENDGNRVLQPVYVQDRFPPGATFIEPSSIRPSELTDSYANWTLTHLSIGGAVNISLSLDVSKCYSASYPPEMVNRVEACGVYDDEQVCASNFSALEVKGLTCCIDEPVAVAKTAEIDPANPRVVRYRINLSNNDDAIRVATVTDRLPAGMSLIEASIPFASYDGDVIVWKIMEIGPFETKTIEFSALASADGRFTNVVEVDPRSVEGTVVGPVRATCVIDVGVVEGECDPIGCGIWQPPNWQFDQVGYQPDVMNCELLTAAGCGSTGTCLAP